MEIEAKYLIPDAATRDALRHLDEIAGYTLSRARRKTIRDVYLDTPERALWQAGYALRQRESADAAILTLKGLGGVQGDLHRREEIEQPLSQPLPPAGWPDGPVRARVLALGLDLSALAPLCEVQQVRTVRRVLAGRRVIAEWSLDHATLIGKRGRTRTWELELELRDGTEEELQRLIAALRERFPLQAEPRSKFERALTLSLFLSPKDRAVCARLAEGEGRYAQRARLLLALDAGESVNAIITRSGVSRPVIYRWRDAYQARGLAAVFPPSQLAAAGFGEKGDASSAAPAVMADGAPSSPAGGRTAPPSASDTAPVSAAPSSAADTVPVSAAPPPRTSPGLTPEDSISEAFRKTLSFHFERMLACEPGTRAGEDIEALHDMRVATRRMRAAFLVFGASLDMEPLAPLLKGLRRTGRTLGAVRDLDVFREKVQHYLDLLPEERRGELEPLWDVLTQQREAARASLLAYLDSPAYQRWVERFRQALAQPLPEPPLLTESGPRPRNVCHLIPALIFERWAVVRAFGPWVGQGDTPLSRYHQLRIAAKALRYTLEYFSELLGKEAKFCLERVKALQDHLGDLQDAVVACNLLRDYLTWGTWGQGEHTPLAEPVIAPGVAAYLAYRQQEVQTLVAGFPPVWATITDASFGEALLTALEKVVG